MTKRTVYKAFDLFCGGGGSSCGARMAGVDPVGGLDIWPEAIQTYRLNFPNASTYCENASRVSAEQVSTEVGKIDLLLVSPECTSHSVARGSKSPCDLSRRTAFEVTRFAEVMQPRWIVVENVVSMQRWTEYAEWLACIRRLGYRSVEAKLDASDFGVSQTRRRLFVICDREREPKLPSKHAGRKPAAKSILQVGATLNGFNYAFSPLLGNGRAKPTLARARRAMKALGKDACFLIVYYGTDAAGGWQSLDRPLRTITTLDRFALVRPGENGHEMRMLQPPELAAAMGFPPDYKWAQTVRRNRIKLVGNAVAPPVMKAIVTSLTKQ